MRSLTYCLLRSLLVVCATLPDAAHGDSTPRETAASEFESAHRAFESGDYEKAQKHYSRAYQLVPHPSTLYNLAPVSYTHLVDAGESASRQSEQPEPMASGNPASSPKP